MSAEITTWWVSHIPGHLAMSLTHTHTHTHTHTESTLLSTYTEKEASALKNQSYTETQKSHVSVHKDI